jgi:hypothetical protein
MPSPKRPLRVAAADEAAIEVHVDRPGAVHLHLGVRIRLDTLLEVSDTAFSYRSKLAERRRPMR